MGRRQRMWGKLYENEPQSRNFYIIFGIFCSASKFVTYVILLVEVSLKLEPISPQQMSFRLIQAQRSSFRLTRTSAHFGSFELIQGHLESLESLVSFELPQAYFGLFHLIQAHQAPWSSFRLILDHLGYFTLIQDILMCFRLI